MRVLTGRRVYKAFSTFLLHPALLPPMAATSKPTAELLAIGHQCSAQYCNLVDFLPYKCQHCEQKFCSEHRVPASHNCAKYDELKHNRVAPPCPLCNTPVTIPVGQDPNIRMERHITNECSVMTGRPNKSTQPHCANPKCKKLLFAPIRCDKCNEQFCPQHRFPSDHICKAAKTQTPPKSGITSTDNADAKMQGPANETSARRNAAMAAIKRSMASASSVKPNSKSSAVQPPRPVSKPSALSISSTSKTTLRVLPKAERSPSPPSATSTPAPLRNRTPSTCADDVANEAKLTKSGPTLYAPPSLFAST